MRLKDLVLNLLPDHPVNFPNLTLLHEAVIMASNGLIPLLIITISSCLLIGMLMYKIDNTDRYRAE